MNPHNKIKNTSMLARSNKQKVIVQDNNQTL